MAVYQALLLNTVVPQIQAAQAGDSYVMVVNATTPALRITQTGTGNALEVEDSSNPDATPFVVSAAGDVGIGTSSPGAKLDVNSSAAAVMRLTRNGGTAANTALQYFNGTVSWYAGMSASGLYSIGYDAALDSGQLRLDSSGNLGLGVTPSAWSAGHTAMQIAFSGAIHGNDSGNNLFVNSNAYFDSVGAFRYIQTGFASSYEQNSGQHRWSTAPSWNGTGSNLISFTQAMTLDASGNLGVGETSPSTFGKVVSRGGTFSLVADTSSQRRLSFWSTANGNSENAYIQVQNDGLTTNTGEMLFATRNTPGTLTERARITNGGDLLVGTTTPTYLLTNGMVVNNPGDVETYVAVGHKTGSGSGSSFFIASYNGGLIGNITQNGTTAVAYNTTSDYRLKDNQQPLTNSGAFIDALKPKTWEWKTDGSKGVGFIAHEVQEVSPGSVVGTKDAVDEDSKPIMQTMEYGSAEFIANIVAELQSLRARVAQLEAK
jgi:hypothetical protein